MEEFASLFSLFILIGKSIEARFYSKIPAILPWIFGTRSEAGWFSMAPSGCFSSMSQLGISQQRGDTGLRSGDTGLTNVEGITVEEMLVWPTRALGMLCWNALLGATDLGYAKGREDSMYWRGWSGKAKSLVNEIPWADLTSESPWGIWRKWPPKSSLWIVSVGLLPSFPLPCSTDTVRAGDPIPRGHLTFLIAMLAVLQQTCLWRR